MKDQEQNPFLEKYEIYLYRYKHEDGFVYGSELRAKDLEDARKHLNAIKNTAILDDDRLTVDTFSPPETNEA